MTVASVTVATEPGITVAGRTFRPVTSLAFEQYNWVTSHLWGVNIDGCVTLPDLLARVAESGQSSALLAGLLREEVNGALEPWTPAGGRDALALFLAVSDFEECGALQMMLLRVLPDFFPSVAASWASSATSSLPTTTTPNTTSEAPRNDSEPVTPSESSAPSSDDLPDLTLLSLPA